MSENVKKLISIQVEFNTHLFIGVLEEKFVVYFPNTYIKVTEMPKTTYNTGMAKIVHGTGSTLDEACTNLYNKLKGNILIIQHGDRKECVLI